MRAVCAVCVCLYPTVLNENTQTTDNETGSKQYDTKFRVFFHAKIPSIIVYCISVCRTACSRRSLALCVCVCILYSFDHNKSLTACHRACARFIVILHKARNFIEILSGLQFTSGFAVGLCGDVMPINLSRAMY